MIDLTALRRQLAENDVDGVLIPRGDRHMGEWTPARDARLAEVTGFTGSAGLAIVMSDRAALFVDGRYELQAKAQAAPGVDVVFMREKTPAAWISETLSSGVRLGYDPWLHSTDQIDKFASAATKADAELVALRRNPVDAAWADQPPQPKTPARIHKHVHAGEYASAKRQRIAETLEAEKLDAAVLTQPDSINWLLNIRGGDIPHTPVTLAFGLIDAESRVTLFTDPEKFDDTLRAHLGDHVTIACWDDLAAALAARKGQRIALDKISAPIAVSHLLEQAEAERVWRRDPCVLPKARKNAVEIQGARDAHLRDGAALSAFLAWLDATAADSSLDEVVIAEKLRGFRERSGARLGHPPCEDSFESVVGFRGNGAMAHYRAKPGACAKIDGRGVLLIDSGAQYLDGTTDVTRAIAIGGPAELDQIRAATAVLQGLIAVSELRFPVKTEGRLLDSFARRALWRMGFNYTHGTGHGVGSYLGVHEGPARIAATGAAALETGMILSNEPGYYRADSFGIRLENLIVVTEAEKPEGGDLAMHGFETLTLAPFDRRLIDAEAMTIEERAWLNAYHARVLKEVGPLIDATARPWLETACRPL